MNKKIGELLNKLEELNKDGGYSAVYSFALKFSMSVSSFLAGYILTLIGYTTIGDQRLSEDIIWRICFVGLIVAPIISLFSLVLMKFYPVNKEFLENLRAEQKTAPELPPNW